MTTPPVPASQVPKKRRRVRVAETTLRRLQHQRERFATEYGKATTPAERFTAVATALRAAAADGAHQIDVDDVARYLVQLTGSMKTVLDELHEAQQDRAEKTLRADERRIERNERRRGCDGRSRTHPNPTHPHTSHPDSGNAAGTTA